MEDVLNIPGSIHSISQEGNAVYANEVFDKRKNKKQQLVNQETDEALEAQNQHIGTLEEAVGEGGSVDERIAQAKSEAESDIKGGASEDYDTLKKTEDAIKAEVNAREEAVSDEASARQDAINTAKTEIIGGASTDCNTLGKAEIKISTNAQDIAQLQAAYEALTQSTPVIVEPTDTWPVASPEEGVIYRVIDRVNTPPQNYSDYMYNGTAMVLMATYDNAIDDIPTPGSNNLVKSGGVASHIVYDISEANAVGSTLATYADLAAALGNNGANIPPSIQKGGMSVKFVQSSDNKYVQARLMANSFTTDVTQWQVVDDEPTAGSNNLVKSGGIYNVEQKLNNSINSLIGGNGLIQLEAGEYKDDGTAADNWVRVRTKNSIPVGLWTLTLQTGYIVHRVCYYNADGTFNKAVGGDGLGFFSNTEKLLAKVTIRNSSSTHFEPSENIVQSLIFQNRYNADLETLQGEISANVEDIQDLNEVVLGTIDISKITFKRGGINTDTGVQTENNSARADTVQYFPKKKYTVQCPNDYELLRLFKYSDTNGTFVGYESMGRVKSFTYSGEYYTKIEFVRADGNNFSSSTPEGLISSIKYTGIIDQLNGLSFWKGTQVEYDALGTYDDNTVYFII